MIPFSYLSDAEEWMNEHASSSPIGVLIGGTRWILDWECTFCGKGNENIRKLMIPDHDIICESCIGYLLIRLLP